MTRQSLDARYFDDVFADDDDPWSLATSAYEDAKFAATIAALGDRGYSRALEVGCAHGVLTRRLAPLCDDLLAVDISARAIHLARSRCHDLPRVRFAQADFARESLATGPLDLVVLSEVIYYWSDADIDRAGLWLRDHLASGGRLLLVHYIRETDYPQTGDEAVAKLFAALHPIVEQQNRTDDYRLDRWCLT